MKSWTFVLPVAVALFAGIAQAQPAVGPACQAKRDAIGRDIEEAKAANQKQRIRGLERALNEVKRNCSDARLEAEQRRAIQRQEKKVAEREREVQVAERQSDVSKVARRKAKLLEEQAELQRIKDGR